MINKRAVAYWSWNCVNDQVMMPGMLATVVYENNAWEVWQPLASVNISGQVGDLPELTPPSRAPDWIRPGWSWDSHRRIVVATTPESEWNDDTMPMRIPVIEPPRDNPICRCLSYKLAHHGHDDTCPLHPDNKK